MAGRTELPRNLSAMMRTVHRHVRDDVDHGALILMAGAIAVGHDAAECGGVGIADEPVEEIGMCSRQRARLAH